MSALNATTSSGNQDASGRRGRASILFVDDEQKVLNSMRASFRREYNVFLANSGAEALKLFDANEIDVVVSDQRMPEMTGVEVLSAVNERKPDCVRLLLTGYADLSAIEAAINEAEVFKYLMKPCPAEDLRASIENGLAARQEQGSAGEVIQFAEALRARGSGPDEAPVAVRTATSKPQRPPAQRRPATARQSVTHTGVLLLSDDRKLITGIREACPTLPVHEASTLDAALTALSAQPIGVLVADMAANERDIHDLSAAVRAVVPDLVLVLASDRSDANTLIDLINSGQVYRFLLKPLHQTQARIWLQSALRKFDAHAVVEIGTTTSQPGFFSRLWRMLTGAS